jgi:TolB-like protein
MAEDVRVTAMNEDFEQVEDPADDSGKTRKKGKLRSVWISFVGRIVAQILGAVASVTLGLLILHKYQKGTGDETLKATVQAAAVPRVAAHVDGTLALAVLPLDSFSPDSRDGYFAAGMTEAIIAGLTSIDRLRVISRTSTMRYGQAGKSVPEIGQELDVDLIVEGSIVKTDRHVRVTAQLIDARTDEHVWARSYDRVSSDVLAVQAAIAAEIARDVQAAVARTQASESTGPVASTGCVPRC